MSVYVLCAVHRRDLNNLSGLCACFKSLLEANKSQSTPMFLVKVGVD